MGDGKGRARNMATEELIGKIVKINAHTDKGLVGLEGKILDETRNTITVDGPRGKAVVPKKGAILIFVSPEFGSSVLQGDRLMFRPEDRIKRCEKVQNGSVKEEE